MRLCTKPIHFERNVVCWKHIFFPEIPNQISRWSDLSRRLTMAFWKSKFTVPMPTWMGWDELVKSIYLHLGVNRFVSFPEQFPNRIFQRWFRTEQSRSRKYWQLPGTFKGLKPTICWFLLPTPGFLYLAAPAARYSGMDALGADQQTSYKDSIPRSPRADHCRSLSQLGRFNPTAGRQETNHWTSVYFIILSSFASKSAKRSDDIADLISWHW